MIFKTIWPTRLCLVAAACVAASSLVGGARAQGVVFIPPRRPPPQSAAHAAPTLPVSAPRALVRIPEGTEVRVQLDEPVSSATASVGDTFSISTDEEIHLADGTVIPAGFSGRGEVTSAEKKGMLGKAGELSVRLEYIKIGDVHVHLRANKGEEGKSGVTTTIVLTVLLTPLFLMHHGHEVVFPQGQQLAAYVDEDADVALPIALPPRHG
jgi:hypothetical protein